MKLSQLPSSLEVSPFDRRFKQRNTTFESFDEKNKEVEYLFPKLEGTISNKISSLGGSFFVKLDCSWVFGTLECKSTTSSTSQIDVINEKSSSEEQKSPKRFNLVLKILCNLYPSQVFRCFVVYTYLLSFVNETFVNSFIICHQSKYQQRRIDQLLEFFNSRSKTIRRARSLQIT